MLKTNSNSHVFSNFRIYLKSAAHDYWVTIGVTAACLTIVIIVQDSSPLMLFRYIMGSLLTLGLPGFSLVAVLWPKKAGSAGQKTGIDWILRVALSIVLSIVIVSMVVSILDFLPIGVGLTSVSLTLSLFTVTFATLAALRNYKNQRVS